MPMKEPSRGANEPTDDEAQRHTEAAGRKRLIRGIMLAVVVWGAFLATGMWLSTRNWRGPAVVMTCVFAFLGFWAWLLSRRAVD